jgi:hypothetical protein
MRYQLSAWARGNEKQIHDEDGLQNHFSLFIIGIRHLYHEIYGFE